MAIVKRIDSIGRKYYYNTTTSTRTTEASYNKSKSSAKSAKTQFKTASGYTCAAAGRTMGKQNKNGGLPKTKKSSRAGATLASKLCK